VITMGKLFTQTDVTFTPILILETRPSQHMHCVMTFAWKMWFVPILLGTLWPKFVTKSKVLNLIPYIYLPFRISVVYVDMLIIETHHRKHQIWLFTICPKVIKIWRNCFLIGNFFSLFFSKFITLCLTFAGIIVYPHTALHIETNTVFLGHLFVNTILWE